MTRNKQASKAEEKKTRAAKEKAPSPVLAETPGETTGNDPAEPPVKSTAPPKDALREKLQPYFDANPKTDVFYVASDGQPFYEKQWAREHQKSLDPKKEVFTVNR